MYEVLRGRLRTSVMISFSEKEEMSQVVAAAVLSFAELSKNSTMLCFRPLVVLPATDAMFVVSLAPHE